MSIQPRTWRLVRYKKAKGVYFALQAGARKGDDRQSITLGYCSEAEAERALRNMQREEIEQYGTRYYDRVLRKYAEGKEGQAFVRDYLFGDAELDDPSVKVEPNWMALPIREYVDRYYGPHRAKSRPRTWRTERHDWDIIKLAIGDTRLGDIDEYVVDDLLTNLRGKRGDPASPNRQLKCRNAISACLTYARRKKHFTKPMPRWFRLEGTTASKPAEDATLPLDEVRRLLDAAKPMHRAIFASCIGLGLRPNEATRLRWEDIDWDRKRVMVRGTKTDGSEAPVPLLPLACGPLEAWWEEQGKPTEGHCFVGERGPYSTKDCSVPWRKALSSAVKKAKISRRVTPYTLRHTAATLLVEAGVPMASVAKMLRHTNPRMLERHYDHTGATKAPGLVDLAPTLD